jgi:hypothetical protein
LLFTGQRYAWRFGGAGGRKPSRRGAVGPGVTLTDSGKTVTLANGVISAAIVKSRAAITSLQFRGHKMLRAGYYSMDGPPIYRVPARCSFWVKSQTSELVDIGMKNQWSNQPQAFDIEIHYMLQRGASGLYSYAILTHSADYPAASGGEWRMVRVGSNGWMILRMLLCPRRAHSGMALIHYRPTVSFPVCHGAP